MIIECDSFVVLEWTDQGDHPGRPVAGLHVHHEDDEAWYVLEGRLGFRIGDELREVGAGESILVRRGTPHTWWNAHAAPTRYLLIMPPRIHRLIEALHAADPTGHAQIFEAHAATLLSD